MQSSETDKPVERISKRFDAQKTSNPFSDKKPHKTFVFSKYSLNYNFNIFRSTFGKLYSDGKIPCRIQHTTSKMYLGWDINLEGMSFF